MPAAPPSATEREAKLTSELERLRARHAQVTEHEAVALDSLASVQANSEALEQELQTLRGRLDESEEEVTDRRRAFGKLKATIEKLRAESKDSEGLSGKRVGDLEEAVGEGLGRRRPTGSGRRTRTRDR